MPDPIPPAFISYSREDSVFALRLAQDLKAAGLVVWLDQLDIKAGRSWDDAVEDALSQAPQMLLILSPASASSKNVRDEISFALSKGKAIVPVRLKKCEVPLRLQRTQQIDFSQDYAAGLANLIRHLQDHAQPSDADELFPAAKTGPKSWKPRPWLLKVTAALLVYAAAAGVLAWKSRRQYHPSDRVLNWYNVGVASLRQGNFIDSTLSLKMASDLDPHFPMAHVRLAEAWTNLDFEANAQQELLLAEPDQARLAPLDLLYFKAINAAVTHEFPNAVKIYTDILERLRPEDKSAGCVDLGFALERNGDQVHALENYAYAASLNPDNAAAFMHIGVLQSRLRHTADAQHAYDSAQTIFYAENNKEGQAVLDYEQGYAANDRGDSAGAKKFLEKSLKEAQDIPSVQLQIRALTQLSSSIARFDAAQAVAYATQAIDLARANRLDQWAANGLVRLAQAQLRQNKLAEAQDSLRQGLQLAHQTRQPRVEALANSQLANFESRQHHPDQVLGPAQAAVDYYQRNGFFGPAANASILITRAQRDKEQTPQALASANLLLPLATKSGDRELMRQAEELLGSILLRMEHYPDALGHFKHAIDLSDAPSSREYDALNAAETLWKLGRTAEFEAMLQFTPTDASFAASIEEERAHSLLSRQQFGAVITLTQHILATSPQLEDDDRQQLLADKAVAEAHLHKKADALKDLDEYRKLAGKQQTAQEFDVDLTVAEIDLALGLPAPAREAAAAAAAHFYPLGRLDSALRSVCLEAAAAAALKDPVAANEFSAKVVDISTQIEQTWTSPQSKTDSQNYFSRPDVKALLQAAHRISP